jgi:hypothetical protein
MTSIFVPEFLLPGNKLRMLIHQSALSCATRGGSLLTAGWPQRFQQKRDTATLQAAAWLSK